MTEDEARQICAELQAVFCIRKRGKGQNLYIYVSRWLPKRAAEAAGYKVSKSYGQSFDHYVCSLANLAELDEATLRQRIAALPQNPNKIEPTGQHLERTSPIIAQWHAEAGTAPELVNTNEEANGGRRKHRRQQEAENDATRPATSSKRPDQKSLTEQEPKQ